jgi:uncharacterized phage protein (TIGR02218 family)
MKKIHPETLARLGAPAATRATCWKVVRRDGAVFGFTDHDRALVFDGITHEPDLGLETGVTTLEPDFASGSAEAAGILSSNAIAEADLAAGLWDGAEVEVHVVDWQDPTHRVLMRRAVIGEVTRAGSAFRAELRGLAHLLDVPQGRVFSHLCDAALGDTRCRVDLVAGGFQASVTVMGGSTVDRVPVSGAPDHPAEWFAGGQLEVLTGALAGAAGEIVSDRKADGVRRLALRDPLSGALAEGVALRLTAGCDKRFQTCREKFLNSLNFQGFPHMPGADHALAYPSRGAAENDGGALVG